jgi:succinate dehydrogenase / fumarate reductase cytochrome b subunit
MRSARPVYLDLLRLHLPVTGWVSILHRASGALLFMAFPVLVWILARSLDQAGFAALTRGLAQPWVQGGGLVLIWALALHFFAGIRHLLLDWHRGLALRQARRNSWLVLAASAGVTLFAAWRFWA